jgi:hypothetical protein
MRISRWMLILIQATSGLAVLAVGGWWWVTWPDRTANEFLELVAQGKTGVALSMTTLDHRDVRWFFDDSVFTWGRPIQTYPRTLSDAVLARRRFNLSHVPYANNYRFAAVRGKMELSGNFFLLIIPPGPDFPLEPEIDSSISTEPSPDDEQR